MTGEQASNGEAEAMVDTLSRDPELRYWAEIARSSRMGPRQTATLREDSLDMLERSGSYGPYAAVILNSGARYCVWERVQDRVASAEAARGQA